MALTFIPAYVWEQWRERRNLEPKLQLLFHDGLEVVVAVSPRGSDRDIRELIVVPLPAVPLLGGAQGPLRDSYWIKT